MTYQEKLKNRKWQQKKHEIFELAGYECEEARCRGGPSEQLQTHHLAYAKGRDPWDYPNELLMCLCAVCHPLRQVEEDKAHAALGIALRKVPIERLNVVAQYLIEQAIREAWK